ncbi:AtpZ/AtpI family protein [Jannaschia seohaensis]|uniref:ATP synthase protein I n=1 Tax=Jannaschia seohaensis TaxID=475081 RepID=A0A2Y9AJN5_9RHOB|nr:AtpZ/AtpI family protein [Jannaschia seohaensis]PWJ20250.1 ATP synthase protein I [Jannaschia seohaensis]SSA44256.1 ATP synthase protein I [Jannaschia seohaensis]
MTEPNHEGRKMISDAVERRQSRREKWEREVERSLWKNLSMMGALGWLVVTPTLIGVFAGRWLDASLETGVTFSGALTFLGACLGFWLAWKRMNEE